VSDALDRLVREAREDLGVREARDLDWDAVDRSLFGRIGEERRAERAKLAPRSLRPWTLVIGGLAAAAVLAVAVGKSRERGPLEGDRATVVDSAGSVIAIEGGGEVLVDGERAATGAVLRLGDVIEARGARAIIERAGKVTFALEETTRATISHVQGSLVLELDRGAVEAQVVPVASGEAFAVDVGASRVAVHGTHLRVARAGERVIVDLSEGVVSVGAAPRVGSTLGDLVTAPAHFEFVAGDTHGTLEVAHDLSAVRSPVSVGPVSKPAPSPVVPPAAVKVETTTEPRPSGAFVVASSHGDVRPSGTPAPATPAPDPNAEAVLAGAVRACMADMPHAENVTVVVSTTLRLELADDGSVRAARFDPPVAPEVNACSVQTIYRTRFTHGGAVAIPVDFKN